jgi:hypothetical protein
LGIAEHRRHIRALACDYDGTIADGGIVATSVANALFRLREGGRRLILVTGRELHDLIQIFPRIDLFHRIVAENGGVLYDPLTREEQLLGAPPPDALVVALQRRGIDPLSVGKVIVATHEPHQQAVAEALRDLGIARNIILNKGAVMLLPPGIDKASGLKAALSALALPASSTVGIGDAENDRAFLSECGCAVAVANALPAVKEAADLVTRGESGAGVVELVEWLMATR